MVLIRTANQQIGIERSGGYIRWIEQTVKMRWRMQIDWRQIDGVVKAEIVNSNWRACCPFCAGAMVIEPGLPFFCPDCCMQANGFRPMYVEMPDEVTRQKIERLLIMRPDPVRRNWFPHETITDIRAENLAHGIGV